jgi:Sec-independent protein translocase protein TatA
MEIGSSFSSGVQGFQRASNNITEETININRQTQQTLAEAPEGRAEQRIAQEVEQSRSLESSVVNLTSELNSAQANVRSIETADEVLGSIIDLRV